MTTSTEISAAQENPMITVDGFKLKKLSIITTFSDTTKIDKVIGKFKKDALSIIPDLSTVKSRGHIASIAYKISKKKTNITNQMIEPSIEEAKALVKSVNAGKKHFQAEMDKLRDEVRAPLNEWEAAEKIREENRIATIKNKIHGIQMLSVFDAGTTASKDDIAEMMEAVDSIDCEEGFAEFTQDALQAKSFAKEKLTEMLNIIIQKEIQDKADEEFAAREVELKEQQLKAEAQERVNKLMMIPVGFFGKSSGEIQKKIDSLTGYEVKESEFGDLTAQAKSSVINVIAQLNAMLSQQFLVEEAAAQKQTSIEQTPFMEEPVVVEHYESKSVEQVAETVIPEQNRTHSRTVITPLTWHQKMINQVNFWYDENGSYDNLMSILNQYK